MVYGGKRDDYFRTIFAIDDICELFADVGDVGFVEDFACGEFHLDGIADFCNFKPCGLLRHYRFSTTGNILLPGRVQPKD